MPGRDDVLSLESLTVKLLVSLQEFHGSGQVVDHQPPEIGSRGRILPDLVQDPLHRGLQLSQLSRDLLVSDLIIEGTDTAHVQNALFYDLPRFGRELGILRPGPEVLRKLVYSRSCSCVRGGAVLFHLIQGSGSLLFLPLALQLQIFVVHPLREHERRLLAVKPGGGKEFLTHHLFEVVQNSLPALPHCPGQLADLQIFGSPGYAPVFIIFSDQLFALLACFDQDPAQDRQCSCHNEEKKARG